MGKRGPKPADVDLLRLKSFVWAASLHHLRDGAPGLLTKTRLGRWRITQPLAELREDEIGYPEKVQERILAGQMSYSPLRYREREVVAIFPVPPTRKALRMEKKLRRLLRRSKDLSFMPPVLPRPEIWERLKKARSVTEVRQVGRSLRQWHPALECEIFHSHAEDLLRAKDLPHYPKSSRRRSSDDKRIWFWAKVLAGVTLGIAPATATKRLARWPLRIPHEYPVGFQSRREREKRK